ncbi:MAG: hypothetical protein ABIR18_09655, partial [Chitinophagaceae bacterium]
LEEIKALVKKFHALLYVIHINTNHEEEYDSEIIEQSASLHKMLKGLRPQYHFLNNTGVEKGLSDFSERNKLDLLIIVPKKHTLLRKLFHKSCSKSLALHTHVPLMAIHE